MRNRVNSCSLGEFEVFLKVHVIIIIRFGEKNALGAEAGLPHKYENKVQRHFKEKI